MQYITTGTLAFGAILTKGTYYVVSANAGGIAPHSDFAAGWYRTILGIATSTSNLRMDVSVSGITP